MELDSAIEIASSLCRRRPAAFICGDPPRIFVSVAWDEQLTEGALALWSVCRGGEVLEGHPLTAFPTCDEGGDGQVIGLLVVAAGHLSAVERRDLSALAAMVSRMNVSLLAGLVKRLQDGDETARRDLLQVLREHEYNIMRTARNLGTTRTTLYKYMHKLEIRTKRGPAGLRFYRDPALE